MDQRVDDEFWALAARTLAAGSRCERRQVAAVVVKNGQQLSFGINTAPPGYPGCYGCPRNLGGARSGVHPDGDPYEGPTACYAVHAEVRAILAVGAEATHGSTMYVTCKPCLPCELVARAAGIERVVYPDE